MPLACTGNVPPLARDRVFTELFSQFSSSGPMNNNVGPSGLRRKLTLVTFNFSFEDNITSTFGLEPVTRILVHRASTACR
ncbi:hypothetical protein SERLADRAFT_373805 [Serpula lacrymans var. lacrymans S7.9]|uniref:Uncharacterized protein n=1 Tax=Serpula lacrymans var. lacrymans (strain S7.9) TaxID=578457 RepID=F8P9T1_SERL9|nr:uncharacterized protein SERLADRAFT_373805 [Serpula lacrymans var. lacrymans S7.9]EGO20410.1 hypothetical protein SERLADRAFT_373805 [Serpula lacrymans var. lacrymans S7.9]